MYIWDKKIEKVDWETVLFEDWTEEKFTKTSLEYLQTEEESTPEKLAETHVNNAVNWLFDIIHKHDVKNKDLVHILNKITNELLYKELWITEIINDMLDVLIEHGIKQELIWRVLSKTSIDYNRNVDAAICKKLGIDDLDDLSAKQITEFKNS